MNTKLGTALLLIGSGVAHSAFADHRGNPQFVFAPVVDVQPLVRQVTVTRPREECWLETSVVPARRGSPSAAGSAIAGGLIGGVIGHQFGSGHRNDSMTVLGALLGSAIGADAASKRAIVPVARREVTTERCEIVDETYREERVDGYRVTYDYMGQRFATVMPEPPRGNRIRLRVSVEAAGY